MNRYDSDRPEPHPSSSNASELKIQRLKFKDQRGAFAVRFCQGHWLMARERLARNVRPAVHLDHPAEAHALLAEWHRDRVYFSSNGDWHRKPGVSSHKTGEIKWPKALSKG